MNSTSSTTLRSNRCGELTASNQDQDVILAGWVHRTRNLGGLVFLDLRDRDGIVQVSFNPDYTPEDVIDAAGNLGLESVVTIQGRVALRPAEMRNADMGTGEIEVHATSLKVLSEAGTLGIPVAGGKGSNLPAEELRLRHRYLDLRRPELQKNLILRHRLLQTTRNFLDRQGFLEIETPVLTKPTPEGSRDYLVPSRIHPGEFYALPQSPQLYKQLLMIAGYDRYFQLARCFRDEDLRADRQPEFTQIDIEASFITPEDIFELTEGMLSSIFKEGGIDLPVTFNRMSYQEAMESYGCDRPDLRYDLKISDYTSVFAPLDFIVTKNAIEAGGRVRGLTVPGGASLSRKQVDEIEAQAKSAGVGGLLRLKYTGGKFEGPVAKFLGDNAAAQFNAQEGDLLLFVAAPDHISNPALDRVRQDVADRLELTSDTDDAILWITDFPMFAVDPETGAVEAVHHPFTAPVPEDIHLLESDPASVRALAYDVVFNGTELGGGSIRINDPSLQRRVLNILGIDEASADERFGFLLEALGAGAPPHGGIALGFDRIAMMLARAPSLRDVIAFPKTTAARALFEGAPSSVPAEELAELHLNPVKI